MSAGGMTKNELMEALQKSTSSLRMTQAGMAKSAGISQAQVSRILSGRFSRNSKAVIQLCKFLEINPEPPLRPKAESKRLQMAVAGVWDGTPRHEMAILRLLEALRAATRM